MRTEEQAFDLISEWHDVSVGKKVDTQDVFFLFMASWVSMNALYNWYGSKAKYSGDKNKLSRFCESNQKAQKIHLDLLQSNRLYQEGVGVLRANGILDVSRNQRVHISDSTIFKEVMLCVYQVRNNLFHGDKLLANERDEQVVTASYIIVSNFLKAYLINAEGDLFGLNEEGMSARI